jgi:tetratricopeptide (TPR) repeat protein
MHRYTIALWLLVASLIANLPAIGEELDERDWHDVRSTNFRILSVLGEERTSELLRQLEIMRATLGDTSETSTYESGIPTIIVAVDKHDDYVAVGAPAMSAGYFFSDLRENAILIEDGADASGIQVILHEYAHYLSRQSGHVRYPRWFEEGNAEYLSHTRLGDGTFEYALAPDEHVTALNFVEWLPLETLLTVDDTSTLDDTQGGLFYAQSWLIVHYLRSQPDADTKLGEQLGKYAELATGGSSPAEAFEKSFGVDLEEFEGRLLQYYLKRRFVSRRVAADTALPGFQTQSIPISSARAQLALARMALRFDNVDGAEYWFSKVLDDADLRAHAEAGLGRVAGLRGDIEDAGKHFEAAIHLMAWDFNIWMDYAQYWAQRVATSRNGDERNRFSSRLIEALESALTISEATAELNSLMGFAYLAKGRDPDEAIEFLEAAAEQAPYDQASRLLLANAYLYVGRLHEAVEVAEAVLRFEHQPNPITAAAHEVIGKARQYMAR